MVGAPPEALKVVLLWEYPTPSIVVLPPDPLYADRINQASIEFLLFNHLFVKGGLSAGRPFTVVCDPGQQERVAVTLRHMLRGPSDAEMTEWRTPAAHRRQLLREMDAVSGPVAGLPLEQLVRVVAFEDDCARLEGAVIENLPDGEVRIKANGGSVTVPRRAQRRAQMPFYFADVENPVAGPRFGLQVIGSASGFSAAEWSSSFIVWINGQPLIVDGTPYLDDHLRRLGIEDDHILGYLITHNHEDHANLVGQLVNRRPVTVLTSGPVMASLVARLAAILDCPQTEVRQLIRWVPLEPGLDDLGPPLHWFGAEIRTWYSVHTVPTLGVDVSMGGKRIRMPGDTLWGRQLQPLLEQRVISPARCRLVQHSYDGADVIVADAGGGPIHPDPEEVREMLCHSNGTRFLVTHVPEFARGFLPIAEPGSCVELIPREERTPSEATGLFGSPVLRDVPERWLLTLLYGGEIVQPGEEEVVLDGEAFVVLAGALTLSEQDQELYPLQRGDVFHRSFLPEGAQPHLRSSARWTRLLRIPEPLFQAFLRDTGLGSRLERLYRTRAWWRGVTGEELGLDTLLALSQLCRERSFTPGSDIVRQGDLANHFYVVTSGNVDVIRADAGQERVVGGFGSGYHFGEIALLAEETRTATVRATAETRVLELPSRAFRRHLMQIPLARYRISSAAARRKRELLAGPPAKPLS
jgi:CRP-like cAMP-binding protein